MGIENRDYVRDENPGGFGAAPMSEYPAVRTIIVITVVIYLLQIFVTRPTTIEDIKQMNPAVIEASERSAELSRQHRDSTASDGSSKKNRRTIDALTDKQLDQELRYAIEHSYPVKTSVPEKWLQLQTDQVLKRGQLWRLLTSAFCHDRLGIWHILFNMLFLFWFGRELESIYGTRTFTWFYVTAAIFSALAYIGIQLLTGERMPAIGASGAVMAVMMVYAIFHPREQFYLFFVIPIQIRFLLLMYIAYDLHPILLKLAGTPVPIGIAHAAHLGGLLYGYVFWKSGFSLQSLWDRTSGVRGKLGNRSRMGRRTTVANGEPGIIPIRGPFANSKSNSRPNKQPNNKPNSKPRRRQSADKAKSADEELEQQVDRILAKISESGRESLSDDEVEVLERASRRYGERPSS